jgi:poly(A) polymerase
LLVRYKTTKSGKQKKLADIYTREDHGIKRRDLNREAIAITSRLHRAGYDAYIVGGAVRDLLINKRPKDFDVVTSALPREIRKTFRNSRIIGRRFQLVHVFFKDTIVEVSTFRTTASESAKNIFGTMSEDVSRRDFTMNALYYDPENEYIIDYVGGYEDIRKGRVKALVPLELSFPEDPVRMIRAIRYSATTGFALYGKISKHLKKRAPLIASVPVSRLTEELFKILSSGSSRAFIESAVEHGLFVHFLPEIDKRLNSETEGDIWDKLAGLLDALDEEIRANRPVQKGAMIAALTGPFYFPPEPVSRDMHLVRKEAFLQLKAVLAPLTPPNMEVEKAVQRLVGGSPKVRHRRRSGRKRTGPRERHPGRETTAQ